MMEEQPIREISPKAPDEPIAIDHANRITVRALDSNTRFHAKYDVLNMTPIIIGSALQAMHKWTDAGSIETAGRLGNLLAVVNDKQTTWSKDMLLAVDAAFEKAPQGFREEFLQNVYRCLMDIYWHGVRQIPNDADKPSVLIGALGMSLALRRMTPEINQVSL